MTKQNLEKAGITNDKPIFPISVVADTLEVHQRTLRIYDDEKLLVPGRTPKNRRMYSFDDIEKGKFIQYLTRELGINLAGIKIIFELLGIIDNYCTVTETPKYDYVSLIKIIAEKLNITPEIQAENKVKLSRRGRKAKI